jgi:hypothetical protein
MAAAIPLRIPMWPIQLKRLIAMLKGAKRNTHAHPNSQPKQAQAKYPCAWVYSINIIYTGHIASRVTFNETLSSYSYPPPDFTMADSRHMHFHN